MNQLNRSKLHLIQVSGNCQCDKSMLQHDESKVNKNYQSLECQYYHSQNPCYILNV